MSKFTIDKLLSFKNNTNGLVVFKYYGDFETLECIYDDVKDDLNYIGNSKYDGSPCFEYKFNSIKRDLFTNFDETIIFLRKYKLMKALKDEMTQEEKSIYTFLNFFMEACDELLIKHVTHNENINNPNVERD